MKIRFDISDDKVDLIMELLSYLPFVKNIKKIPKKDKPNEK